MLINTHSKKRFSIFPSPAGMSLTKLFLGRNYDVIFPPSVSLVSDIPAGDGNIEKLFLLCIVKLYLNAGVSLQLSSSCKCVYFASTAGMYFKK
jgi:hypothetical protein